MDRPTLIGVGNLIPKEATRADLFGLFGDGVPVSIYQWDSGGWATGVIQKVYLESGFTPPSRPTCFMVALAGHKKEYFVRTVA